jgi:general secretion pathway protein B
MSFILDALKKSEAERNRKSGPVLMDMRIASPRRHFPAWVWVIALVLLANLALLGYALLRTGTKDTPATPVAATPPAPAPAQDTTGALPPPTLPAPASAAANSPTSAPENAPTEIPAAPAAGGVIMQSNAVVSPGNSVPGGNEATSARTDYATGNLPSDDDLRASGVTLPELRLSLHVYDDVAANRFILLNSSRLREGQETPEGVMVERIDPVGVVLSWHGRRFRMHPGN